ncbi:coiled-coil domain-containing protein 86 [Genypterus blacodes]|uniref:coiled-coil domain-containing protein 86 n=1 Tax=Genypterus blacodes TaxID=154954 RepID=UPI003F760CB2
MSEDKTTTEMLQDEEMDDEPVPVSSRTRSGRKVRTPAALMSYETPVPARTPSRRTRRSVLQELPAEEEGNTEEMEREPGEILAEETAIVCGEPCEAVPTCVPLQVEPSSEAAAPTDTQAGDAPLLPRPAAVETAPARAETIPKKKPRLVSGAIQNPVIPLGKPKSGRVWKDRNKQRFSALVRDKPLCSSWEKKMQAKQEKNLVKTYSLQLKEEKAKQKEDKRKRREETLKRREENERKAEIVQVIRNTSKIKRMKKKQLRKIEKRDTLALVRKNQNAKAKEARQRITKGDKVQDLA